MKTKILNTYDINLRSFTMNDYIDNEYGFKGIYTHKDMGQVIVKLVQTTTRYYILILNVTINGREYFRSIKLNQKCTHRFAGLKAKKFLEDIKKLKEDELK